MRLRMLPLARLTAVMYFVATIAILTSSGQEPKDEPPAKVTIKDVNEWVEQLNSNSFIARETAMQQLVDAGTLAIEPVRQALSAKNLEVTTRSIHVLRELALSTDEDTGNTARKALEDIARDGRGTSVARRAIATLLALDEIRQSRAIEDLEKLGAELSRGNFQLGAAIVFDVYGVEIGANWTGEAKDLARLKWLKSVRQVTLTGEKVTDEYLKHVSAMKAVRYVLVKRASITDTAIAHLKDLASVEIVAVMYCPITNKSAEHFKALTNVSTFRIYGTEMTKDAAEKLQVALADKKVDHRLGAFLGVGCQPHDDGCEIIEVRDNTAAMKADLRRGDVIIKYGGKKVTDFDGLTALIAANRAGESVAIEVIRGDETLSKTIMLGEWD